LPGKGRHTPNASVTKNFTFVSTKKRNGPLKKDAAKPREGKVERLTPDRGTLGGVYSGRSKKRSEPGSGENLRG